MNRPSDLCAPYSIWGCLGAHIHQGETARWGRSTVASAWSRETPTKSTRTFLSGSPIDDPTLLVPDTTNGTDIFTLGWCQGGLCRHMFQSHGVFGCGSPLSHPDMKVGAVHRLSASEVWPATGSQGSSPSTALPAGRRSRCPF